MKTLNGRLENVTYFDTSLNGNSRYTATIEGTIFYTKPDSSFSIDVRNLENKLVSASVALYRGELCLFDIVENTTINLNSSYIDSQFAKIYATNHNHLAGVLQIKGDCGGQTNWLNISAKQLEAIKEILITSPNYN